MLYFPETNNITNFQLPQSSTASIRFPRTQLLQRRRSAAANSPSENASPFERHQRPQRSRSNREKSVEGEFEKDERFKQWNASYYGRDVIKLMEHHMKRKNERENSLKNKCILTNDSKVCNKNNIQNLLEQPSLIFPFEEELFFSSFNAEKEQISSTNNKTNFVGRKWLFNKLLNILMEERIKIILLVGASGSGKSAIIRHLLEYSHFGTQKVFN